MNCSKCNSILVIDANFCEHCGAARSKSRFTKAASPKPSRMYWKFVLATLVIGLLTWKLVGEEYLLLNQAIKAHNEQELNQAIKAHNEQDYQAAFPKLKALSEQGNSKAQYYLGLMYSNGAGVTQDQSKAFEWFSKSAEKGYEYSQHQVAKAYAYGVGVEVNKAMAQKWIQKLEENESFKGDARFNAMKTHVETISASRASASPSKSKSSELRAVEITDLKFRYDGKKVSYVAQINNTSSQKLEGKVCLRFYDKEGFEVAKLLGDELNIESKGKSSITGSRYIKSDLIDQVTTAKLYVARFGCADSPAEAISAVLDSKFEVAADVKPDLGAANKVVNTPPNNEALVEYLVNGVKRNACNDFLQHHYGLYRLAKGHPDNEKELNQNIFKGVTEDQFTEGTVSAIVKRGLLDHETAKAAKPSGYIHMIITMKMNNNNLPREYLDNWSNAVDKCLQHVKTK